MRRGVLRGLDLVEVPLDLDDQLIEPCIEPVRIRLLACDLPGDLSLSVVHGPASQPVRPLAAPTPGGTRGGGARWSIMVDGPGCACHQVTDIQTAAREETAMRDP